MERRLAAILAADVVGFSRLMEIDEAGTLATLKVRRKEILQPLVAKDRGRIFKVAGDGVLVAFASTVNAVQCAVELQQAMAAANRGQPGSRTIVLRVGINLGDVIVEGTDLYGDGVNIAARLEALAEPGSILVSGAVYDSVKNKIKVAFEDLGAQRLKNIAEPVRAYRLTGTTAVADPTPRTITDKPSIAVLPFTNMSGDPSQEYFSDGIAEDIITELSRSRDLLVIARNSSFQYRGKAVDVKRTGRELGAEYVVEGSVQKAGNRARITAQLITAATGNHLWAERYDRDLEDVFTVQDEVVRTIVTTLVGRVAEGGAEKAKRKPPQLWAAYDHFIRGRAHYHRYDLDAAEAPLRRSIELDPGYAPAYGRLASCLVLKYYTGGQDADLQEALRLAQTAIVLDPHDSCSHWTLAFVYLTMKRLDLAGIHFDRATALNPNDVDASINRGLWFVFMGRGEEALRSLDADLRRDPFPPTYYWEIRGMALFQTRRYEEAIEAFNRMDLLHWWTHCYMVACHAHSGSEAAARADATELLRLKPDFVIDDLERSESYRDPADLEHLKAGLRKVELPG
ncbi:adenylate/guanylate cyclase domain-containing protein [Mesorhizobium sp.]|uniref:adenylate/guanylate cyclase domain-containing protein n=1 Tax=Mesorhizobium sp. TaxID=1871066 RepID=UPI000FEA0DE5|nr:adenylate/guanylate cyclase domain-containing protein [Mesorhizobium sp.]RWP95736.1 MAG: tetratricopeptide repeat protein [Mesorhizobium sp.]